MTDNGIELTARQDRRDHVHPGLTATLRRPAVHLGIALGVLNLLDLGRFEPAGFLTWLLPLLALCYLVLGVARRRRTTREILTRQSAGLLLFTVIALVALVVDATIGQYVVAAGYLAHAAWDYAHRDGRVVPRWFVDFCVPFDILIAASLVLAALR
ncbi:hypothetical protein [Micromonospora sp. NBC_01796]|uniref:hypothetical protein n=1 Tax=Micromonospora sp. NBC_01796 TaxID=2975987 RepID=UPI002DDA0BAB|nr:hypothetical protein [Micromonospora sp. NBC_01796]WSA88254.1 hypothetical protein OIE47_11905 [Micromonospora sp. NBC_01796]